MKKDRSFDVKSTFRCPHYSFEECWYSIKRIVLDLDGNSFNGNFFLETFKEKDPQYSRWMLAASKYYGFIEGTNNEFYFSHEVNNQMKNGLSIDFVYFSIMNTPVNKKISEHFNWDLSMDLDFNYFIQFLKEKGNYKDEKIKEYNYVFEKNKLFYDKLKNNAYTKFKDLLNKSNTYNEIINFPKPMNEMNYEELENLKNSLQLVVDDINRCQFKIKNSL